VSQSRNQDRVVDAAAKVVVAAGREAAQPNATPGTVALSAVVALLPPLVVLAWSTARDWSKKRVEDWWGHVSQRLDSEELREAVEERILREQAERPGEVPRTSTVITESLAALSRNPDEAVVPALASLAARYMRDDKGVDWFFRTMVRVLSDLDSRGLEDLRFVTAATQEFEPPGVDLQPTLLQADEWELHQADELFEDGRNPRHVPLQLATKGFLALLLRQHGLAWPSGTGGSRQSAVRCFLDREVMAQVLEIVGAPQVRTEQ